MIADGLATRAHTLILDVAADCRTYAPTAARGETNMVTGKIFTGGTLASGTADNPNVPIAALVARGTTTDLLEYCVRQHIGVLALGT